MGFDNHMIAGNRACSTSTPTRQNRTMPRPCSNHHQVGVRGRRLDEKVIDVLQERLAHGRGGDFVKPVEYQQPRIVQQPGAQATGVHQSWLVATELVG
jgi:hypothetical protein